MAIFNLSIKLSFVKSRKMMLLGSFLGVTSLTIAALLLFLYQYRTSIYPNIFIEEVPVGGLTQEQALQKIQDAQRSLPLQNITLTVDDIAIASTSAQLGAKSDFTSAVEAAYKYGRNGSMDQRLITLTNLFRQQENILIHTEYDLNELQLMISKLKESVDIEGFSPSAQLAYSGSSTSLTIDSGKDGRELEAEPTLQLLLEKLRKEDEKNDTLASLTLPALVASTSAQLSPDEVLQAQERAKKFIGKSVTFLEESDQSDALSQKLNDQEMINLLTFPLGYSNEKTALLLTTWEEKLSRLPQDAEFLYNPDTLVVEKFVPPLDGITLDTEKTQVMIFDLMRDVENGNEIAEEVVLPLANQPPLVTLADTNNLGINERIGFGDSYYSHSIPGRIHNVALTTKKINFTIVPPGAEFSFNKTLGEVSQRTGFRPAYVIKDGATILGDGGGVCQVSTTLFRSLLDAGLLITKRKPHSYRVGYYEQNSKPGIDATVYSGDVDLRFINDTDHHVLIYGETDSNNLYMKIELYGTSDGRTTEIKDFQQWDARPPLATQYIPDPSLQPGQLKQIDWSAPGLKTSFVHVVKDKDGNVMHEEKYASNYRPWAAKYLQGV